MLQYNRLHKYTRYVTSMQGLDMQDCQSHQCLLWGVGISNHLGDVVALNFTLQLTLLS